MLFNISRQTNEIKQQSKNHFTDIQHQTQSATINAAQTSIPQEIATMSDNDLISFINPNAFDQGNYN